MHKLLSVIIFVIFFSTNIIAQVNESEEDEKPAATSIEALETQLEDLIKYHGIPGLSVAVIENGQTVLLRGIGLANIENNIPATERTLFRIGSISKMFVSLAILKLVEEGQLDLQTPVKDLIPEIEFTNPYAETDPVRVIHLLEHTTGWDDIHLPEYALNDPSPIDLKTGLDFHPHSRVSRWRPGERMSYANSGPPVAAYIVQIISGVDFEDYVQTHFFNRLNMQHATYRLPNENEPQATLYVDRTPQDYWHILMRTSGAINATANDMANLLQFFINRGSFEGSQILAESSITKMETPSSTLAASAGMKHGYGMSNYSSFHQNFRFQGHNGGVQGGSSELAYIAQVGLGYAIAINTNSTGRGDIAKAIVKYLTRDMAVSVTPPVIELNRDIIAQYTGLYMPVNPRQELSRFIDQITGVRKLILNTTSATLSSGDEPRNYLPVSDKLLRLDERADASLVLLKDDKGYAIQVGNEYLQQISPLRHYIQQTFLWGFVALLVAQFIWFWWWMGRRLLGKIKSAPSMQVHIWPFFASVSVYVFLLSMIAGQMMDPFKMLGEVSWVSLSIFIASYTFAIFSIVGIVQNVRYIKEEINGFSRYFSLFTCVIYLMVSAYCAYFGIIGLRTFA